MKKPNTGYWMFMCNPNKWEIDRFIKSGVTEDIYSISDFHKDYFKSGELGIIRVGRDNRSKKKLGGNPRLQPGIYAIVRVMSQPQKIVSDKSDFWINKDDGQIPRYRVKLEYISTHLNNPLLLSDLEDTAIKEEDPLIFAGIQASTYPISKVSFDIINDRLHNIPIRNVQSTQIIDTVRFLTYFDMFKALVNQNSNEGFTSFSQNEYLLNSEGYKDSVFSKANILLDYEEWKEKEIGTGRIFAKVVAALQARKNLVPWQDVERFASIGPNKDTSKRLEQAFFDFYRGIKSDRESFILLQELIPNHYSLMSFFFFLKNKLQYLPVSTTRFEMALKLLGIQDFTLSGNCSWDNYNLYISYIKQVQQLLIEFGIEEVSLLDAHSFVWIIATVSQELEDQQITEFRFTEHLEQYDSLTPNERETVVMARVGQGSYRKSLLQYWNYCSVTGCRNENMLIASHIKPWKACTLLESTDKDNGLLLVPNLDRAFDQGLISFDNEGKISISPHISEEDLSRLGISIYMRLHKTLTEKQKKYFEYHRKHIFKT
ncbi:MAG: EVE domain-containing protein [Sphaerochaeta sp.]|nr:EVE domain-containing protein [Sphaerochaeta sp.]